jgi:3-oxoacyl-[acyl-carrier protein] reductase
MGKLDGKVAIVTGAARGLGRAYAKRLGGLGAKVAVADLNLGSYEEFEAEAKDMTADSTVAEVEAAGGTALGIEMDVRDHEGVEAMVARVVQEWGRVDVLVANAGGGRGRPIDTKASTLDPALLCLMLISNRVLDRDPNCFDQKLLSDVPRQDGISREWSAGINVTTLNTIRVPNFLGASTTRTRE